MLFRENKAGTVTIRKLFPVFPGKFFRDDRSYGVDDISARQVKRGRDFCQTARFPLSLFLQDLCTGKPELYPGIGMDGVVNAPVIRAETAEHNTVRCVDDRIA